MSDHIADRAGFLAALSDQDDERAQAEDHARSCRACREALDEGFRLVALLRHALPVEVLTANQLAGAAAAIERETAHERRATRRLTALSVGAVATAWAFQLMVGSGFVLDVRHAVVSLAVVAVAIAGVTLMRGRQRLAVAAMLGISALLAVAAGTSFGFDASIGIRCTFRELWAAAIPWGVAITFARREGLSLGRWDLTAVTAAGALAAHAGQHLACQVPHSEGHLVVFHFSAVLLATLLGAASSRLVTRRA
jgi:hypothetical protein